MRYIEIVFDNSGSMNNCLDHDQKRIDIAKQLFQTEILPTIGLPGDTVILRTLRRSCEEPSTGTFLPNGHDEILKVIQGIYPNGGTPLYRTVKDAVMACKKSNADEKIIFVLTDGEDTCGTPMEYIIDKEDLKWIKTWNVLLMQFAVANATTQNNLNVFGKYLGATTFAVGSAGRTQLDTMRFDLRKALINSGMSTDVPLTWCYDSKEGDNETWKELTTHGYVFYQALLLHEEGFLSWQPYLDEEVTPLQKAELDFLRGIRFNTALPKETMKAILNGLQAPYYYSHDCIYWDFFEVRWKYLPTTHDVAYTPNTEAAIAEDYGSLDREDETEGYIKNKERYLEDAVYEVTTEDNLFGVSYTLEYIDSNLIRKGVKTLKSGQQVRFKHK